MSNRNNEDIERLKPVILSSACETFEYTFFPVFDIEGGNSMKKSDPCVKHWGHFASTLVAT